MIGINLRDNGAKPAPFRDNPVARVTNSVRP